MVLAPAPAAAERACQSASGVEACVEVVAEPTWRIAAAGYSARAANDTTGASVACGELTAWSSGISRGDCGTGHGGGLTGSTGTCSGAGDRLLVSPLGAGGWHLVCVRHESAMLGTQQACLDAAFGATALGSGAFADGCGVSASPALGHHGLCPGGRAIATLYVELELRHCGGHWATARASHWEGASVCAPSGCLRLP